ncbi:MAG: TonB family protein [Terriglobales bacterium]
MRQRVSRLLIAALAWGGIAVDGQTHGNSSLNMNLRTFAIGAILLSGAIFGHAQEVQVIANPSFAMDAISPDDLKSVYLEERNSLAGSRVEPVLSRGGRAHEAFLRRFLGLDDTELQNYYRSLIFTGRGNMPRVFDSDAEVISYVAKTRGAIGYVSGNVSTLGVRSLAVVVNKQEPHVLYRVNPQYPEIMRAHALGGTVRLSVTVAPSGSVKKVDLIGGDPVLGQAAAAAIAQWKYAPRSSPSTVEVIITFNPNR